MIPMVATGRATVYEWKCVGRVPEVVRQVAQPDARGFLSHIWYAMSPEQSWGKGTLKAMWLR